MTKQEIINCLRKYRYDRPNRPYGCTIYNVAALVGTDRVNIESLRDHGISAGPGWLKRVERALEMIENGDVRFVQQFDAGQARDAKGHFLKREPGIERWRTEWVNKPKRRPPPQEKITPAGDHASWARCRTCQGDKWTPVVMNGRPYYFCAKCVGPVHWPGMGAKAADAKQRLAMFEQVVREDFSFLREG